jgi:hypothetical protein
MKRSTNHSRNAAPIPGPLSSPRSKAATAWRDPVLKKLSPSMKAKARKASAIFLIRMKKTKRPNRQITTYGLKHMAESLYEDTYGECAYIPAPIFHREARKMGFAYEEHPDGLHLYLNVVRP